MGFVVSMCWQPAFCLVFRRWSFCEQFDHVEFFSFSSQTRLWWRAHLRVFCTFFGWCTVHLLKGFASLRRMSRSWLIVSPLACGIRPPNRVKGPFPVRSPWTPDAVRPDWPRAASRRQPDKGYAVYYPVCFECFAQHGVGEKDHDWAFSSFNFSFPFSFPFLFPISATAKATTN